MERRILLSNLPVLFFRHYGGLIAAVKGLDQMLAFRRIYGLTRPHRLFILPLVDIDVALNTPYLAEQIQPDFKVPTAEIGPSQEVFFRCHALSLLKADQEDITGYMTNPPWKIERHLRLITGGKS